MAQIADTYYFGANRTPNKVTRVVPLDGHNQYIARVYLVGPRGGEFTAYVRKDGSCRKI